MVFDIDGVLTNGDLIYGKNGEEWKVFNVKDGLAIKLLNRNIIVAVISGNSGSPLEIRFQNLGLKYVFLGIKDKKQVLESLQKELGISQKETAFMGDDWNDLTVRSIVSLFFCPSDATESVKKRSDFISRFPGGRGAAREVSELFLKEIYRSKYLFLDGLVERNN